MSVVIVLGSMIFALTEGNNALGDDSQDVEPVAESIEDLRPYDSHRACGPMCLAFVTRLFGHQSDYNHVVALCELNTDGTSLLQLKRAAISLGYHVVPLRVSVDALKTAQQPAILHFKGTEPVDDHFVVSLGLVKSSNKFQIFDPAFGLVRIDELELAQHFSGVCLLISPNEISLPVTDADVRLTSGWVWSVVTGLTMLNVMLLLRLLVPVWKGIGVSRAMLLALVSLMTYGTGNGCSRIDSEGSLFVDAPIVDVGNVTPNQRVRHEFVVRNRGVNSIAIISAIPASSCKCNGEVVQHDSPIPANGQGRVVVELPQDADVGPFHRRFIVETDALTETERHLVLEVKGVVVPFIRASPSNVNFGVIAPHAAASAERHIAILSDVCDGLRVDDFTLSTSNGVRAERVVHRSQPSIHVALPEIMPVGTFHERILVYCLKPDQSNRFHSVMIDVSGRIEGEIRVVPSIARVDPALKVAKLRLEHCQREPFRIEYVKLSNHGDVSWETIAETDNLAWLVAVSVPNELTSGGEILEIGTDCSACPQLLVRLE